MAYSELIKNFNRTRDYMRDFYIYGFKRREEFTSKSARSYDDERRRLESWLGDYMKFHQNSDGKNVFITVNSRITTHNPLFKAWKTKSFTDGDITLHFIIFDILSSPEISMTAGQLTAKVDDYLSCFSTPKTFDESTVRKKLNEYVKEGLLLTEKHGKSVYYHRAGLTVLPGSDILDYFTEVLPCGVIGSFLLDKIPTHDSHFAFKHHYITETMDSEILCSVFTAIREHRSITLETINRHKGRTTEKQVIPLKVMISVQSGRQYMMAYTQRDKRIQAFRTENIVSVKLDDICDRFDALQEKFTGMLPHMWGVSTNSRSGNHMEHVEFTVHYTDDEQHIRNRLEREKRCGVVEEIDSNTCRFSADVYDASEMIPWIRTFICRITDLHFSDSSMEQQFRSDINLMYHLYGLGDDT